MHRKIINPDNMFNSRQYGFSQAVEAVGIKEQTIRAMENLKTLLQADDGNPEHQTLHQGRHQQPRRTGTYRPDTC